MSKAQEAARELEELGYGCIWVPEAVGREPFASCALLLAGTQRIGVATGIASMYARSAVTMQAGWRTLTEAFGERFTLGIGASHEHMATKLHKTRYDKPYTAMVEYLDQMDKGLYAAVAPTTAPRRVLAALGPRMLALSAERGLGDRPDESPRDCPQLHGYLYSPAELCQQSATAWLHRRRPRRQAATTE